MKRRSKDGPVSFLVHWIPALAGGFVLLIAGLVLEALIRAERRRHVPRPGSSDSGKRDGLSHV